MWWIAVVIALLVSAGAAGAVDVLTSRYNLGRTGANTDERALTPARVSAGTFGKLWTLYADGQVVAQPLYVSGLAVDTSSNPNTPRVQGTFNAVLVATMHNTVYLYDADRERPGPQGQNVPLWATWLGQPRPGDGNVDMFYTNDPEWGILATPVIDTAKSIVYVVAWHDDGGAQNYKYRLHALRLKDGSHAAPPVAIDAPGLNPRHQKQRAGLVLVGGVLYVAFGGDGSRGLVVAYDSASLARRAVWASTPTGGDGGIWQAGQAPSVDADGNLYLMTGNGSFDADTGGQNYGESFVKLKLEGTAFAVKDHFTPCNAIYQNGQDMDLGSAGPVLVPGQKIVFGGGKDGHLYVLATDRLGKYAAPPQRNAATCANPNALQDVKKAALGHLHGSPVYWEGPDGGRVFLWGENDRLRAYRFANRRVAANPTLGEYNPPKGMPGGMLAVSSQGKTNGILWAVVPLNGDANKFRGVKGIVLAMDARDVTRTLWTSEQSAGRDQLGLFAKFVPPTVADGKVFVATYGDEEALRQYGGAVRPQAFPRRYQITVYGMLADQPAPVVDQTRDDVQLVRASVENAVALDTSRCRPETGDVIDCTDELGRAAGAPSLERVTAPAGTAFAGCRLLRVTTAAKRAALSAALGIGFYASDTVSGQFSADRGRLVPAADLKQTGTGTLKSGEAAVLHEFSALVGCELAPGGSAGKQLKPYMDFAGGPPRTVYRNWDLVAGNYALGPPPSIDRAADVLR